MFRKPMVVEIADLSVSDAPGGRLARFTQTWSSGTYRDIGTKELLVVGGGKIAHEEQLTAQIVTLDAGALPGVADPAAALAASVPAQVPSSPPAPPATPAPPEGAPPERAPAIRSEPKTGLGFVKIPAGSYVDNNRQQRSVNEFWLGRTDVTTTAYFACVDAGACSWTHGGARCNGRGQANEPINCVSSNDAAAFCKWVGGRLPTTDEMEMLMTSRATSAAGEPDVLKRWANWAGGIWTCGGRSGHCPAPEYGTAPDVGIRCAQ